MSDIIYLTGAITGVLDAEECFERASVDLRAVGHEVINPFEICWNIPRTLTSGHYWVRCMSVCFAYLPRATAVAIVNNINDSHGASMEIIAAQKLNIPVAPVAYWLLRGRE